MPGRHDVPGGGALDGSRAGAARPGGGLRCRADVLRSAASEQRLPAGGARAGATVRARLRRGGGGRRSLGVVRGDGAGVLRRAGAGGG